MRKTLAVTGITLASFAAVTLSACSSSGTSSSSPTTAPGHSSSSVTMSAAASGSSTAQMGSPAAGPHNGADVTFATDMNPHHAQALVMAELALREATSPKIKELASRIKSEQSPEIISMSGWLNGWNEPVPDTSMGSMDMQGGSAGATMPGMMSGADMAALSAATGASFDKLFLDQMITHHTGAVTMARTELAQGENSTAKALARSIIAGQSREITEMKALQQTGS